MLSIYFEELAAHNHQQLKEAEDNAHANDYQDSGPRKRVVARFADDNDDDEDEDE